MSELVIKGLWAFLACAGFCTVFNVQNKRVAFAACFGGCLMWMVYLVYAPYNTMLASLMSSITVSVYSEVMARRMGTPRTIFLIVGILPLVPGGGIYYTMYYCIMGNTQLFLQKGLGTIATAGIIAVSVSLVSSAFRIVEGLKNV